MNKHKEMKIGMLLNYISMALEGIIIFLINPFIIRALGQETYGVYSLMTSFTGYLSVFEFGLGTTIIRYISKYNEENKEEEKENFLSMIFVIYFSITVLIIISCFVLYNLIDTIFASSLTGEQIILAKKLFIIIASSITVTTIGSVFSAIITGYEKFVFSRSLVLFTTILNVILNMIIIIVAPTAVGLTFISLIIAVISIIVNIIYVFYKLKIRIKFHKWDKGFFEEIFKFSIFIFIQTLITQIYWRLDQLIIGVEIVNSSVALAIYAVAMKINDLVLAFTTVINRYQLPILTKKVVNHDDSISEYLGKVSKFVAILYCGIVLGLIFFGKKFVLIYAGKGYEQAYYIILIVVIASALNRIHGCGRDVLKAKNIHGTYTLIVFISALMNIGLTVYLIPKYGIIGAAIGTAVSVILGNTIAYYWCLSKKADINLKTLFKTTFNGFDKVIIISIISCIGLNFAIGDEIVFYIIKCFIFVVIYFSLIYLFVLDENEKMRIIKKVKK